MRLWLRNLAIGAGVGFTVGLVVGGTLGRVFMRILFLLDEGTLGFATAMGAIVGDVTREGTAGIYGFAAIAGMALGLGYTAARTLLPSALRLRVTVFTLGTTAFMVGQITRANQEDFTFLPVTVSLVLVVTSVALTAAPVPLLIERFAPDRERDPGRLAHGVVALGMTGFVLFAVSGVVLAYSEPRFF